MEETTLNSKNIYSVLAQINRLEETNKNMENETTGTELVEETAEVTGTETPEAVAE